MSRVQFEDGSASDSSSSDDENAELLTSAMDADIVATLAAIRSKDPRIYDKSTKFYRDDKSLPTSAVDVVASEPEEAGKADASLPPAQEWAAAKAAFLDAASGIVLWGHDCVVRVADAFCVP